MASKRPPPPYGYPLPPSAKDGELRGAQWVMPNPISPQSHPANQHSSIWVPIDCSPASPTAAYNPSNANYCSAPAPAPAAPVQTTSSNPYVHASPVNGSSHKRAKETICKLLDRYERKLEDSTKKAGDLAGNVWHHLRTGPSVTDAAMARLAQGTKILAEGGNDKVFQQNFGIYPGEQLRKAFVCYLSTSTGPIIGTLYLSTLRLAFRSDNPLCHNTRSGQQEWIYYKVAVQLDQLKAVHPFPNKKNSAEKYIQIVTSDDYEFWFMGFVSYDKALKNLRESLERPDMKHNG